MKFRFLVFLAVFAFFVNLSTVSAQVDSLIGQVTSSNFESFGSGISGNGRFIVVESTGNFATDNPRNTDGNREIFLFDYAQRRIFQITDTKSLLIDTTLGTTGDNIKVEIVNSRPNISNDGRWIAFSSNATYAFPGDGTNPPIVSTSNPGSFDANSFTSSTGVNNLVNDGNTEIWLYQVPMTSNVDLSLGTELPLTSLETGSFTRVTNSFPSVLPSPGSGTTFAVIANDNRDVSISDDGNVISFTSNRDLVTGGNTFPDADNDEIFTYSRTSTSISQVTLTPRGTILAPVFSLNSNISGNGSRVAFFSNGNNPTVGMTGGDNADRNLEIFWSDLDANGAPTGTRRQITRTTRTNPGDIVNIFGFGRRMSRDGRFIAYDSFADIQADGSATTNETSFGLYLYDTTTNMTRMITQRSTADSGVAGGDVNRFPGFTDYDVTGVPQTLVLNTRLNIKADGTIPTTEADGLNPDETRPVQIYSYDIASTPAAGTFKRMTKLPALTTIAVPIQAITSNSLSRLTFNLSLAELGTGNFDQLSEVYYLLTPTVRRATATNMSFATGATRIPVSAEPLPTPSPTTTPTPTPTPSPSPTPTPTPTPETPAAVYGISPGILAIVNYDAGFGNPVNVVTAEGSISRSFSLPVELGGVSMTINGIACGLKSVGRREIKFVAPRALSVSATEGVKYQVVINNNGIQFKHDVTLVTARPDMFTYSFTDFDGNVFTDRARIFNVTNRVATREPFTVKTLKYRGGVKVPTVLRVYVTGVESAPASVIFLRIGGERISGLANLSDAVLREPGVYSVDFLLPAELDMSGEVPIVFRVEFSNLVYESRAEDTAPLFRIL